MNTETKPCEIQVTPGKMDPSWKAAWINALRSGEFKEKHMVWRDQKNDACGCAIGALTWVLGICKEEMAHGGLDRFAEEVTRKSGLSGQSIRIVSNLFEFGQTRLVCEQGDLFREDNKNNFAYMADWIEANL